METRVGGTIFSITRNFPEDVSAMDILLKRDQIFTSRRGLDWGN